MRCRGLSAHSLVVTEVGHVQLVDFKGARRDDGSRAYTLCGSPEWVVVPGMMGLPRRCGMPRPPWSLFSREGGGGREQNRECVRTISCAHMHIHP